MELMCIQSCLIQMLLHFILSLPVSAYAIDMGIETTINYFTLCLREWIAIHSITLKTFYCQLPATPLTVFWFHIGFSLSEHTTIINCLHFYSCVLVGHYILHHLKKLYNYQSSLSGKSNKSSSVRIVSLRHAAL